MKKENETEFRSTIISLIEKTKKENETYETPKKGADFFTKTGLKSFDIPPNSYIELKIIHDSNFETFRNIYLQLASRINLSDFSVALICNLSSETVHRFIKQLDTGTKFIVVSGDDLNNIEFDLLSEKNAVDVPSNIFSRLDKAISFERFNEFLMTLVRVNILIDAFPSGKVSMSRLMAQKDDILPFAYHDPENKWHIFIRSRSKYTKRSILFRDNAIVHRVKIEANDKSTLLTIDGNEIEFKKISKTWFGHHIQFFNSCSAIDIIPQNIQYKYRSFGKSSSDEFDENDVDKYKYVKKVIEHDEIYFSTKKELNDPFDLDADMFGSITHLTSSNFRIFCVAGRNDNILMWSHYGDSHSGYCTGYEPFEILSSIEKSDKIDFCVYGKVNYKKTRKASAKSFSYLPAYFDEETTAFALQIAQLFKKFDDWSYEGEFRYIISTSKPLTKTDSSSVTVKETGLALKVKPKSYFFGHRFDFNSKTKSYLSNYIGDKCYSFELSKTEYELLPKEIDLI